MILAGDSALLPRLRSLWPCWNQYFHVGRLSCVPFAPKSTASGQTYITNQNNALLRSCKSGWQSQQGQAPAVLVAWYRI